MKKYLFFLAFILPFMVMGQVAMHPTNITVNSKGRIDSVYYEKDSTVKGWIVYYKKGLITKETTGYNSGHYPVKVSIIVYGVEQVITPATAYYREASAFRVINPDGSGSWQADWKLYKIEVDGKPFDLSKYYQFIPDNQVVE